jgi:hypothetical protein
MAEAAKGLIVELDTQFPEQASMDVIRIVYPQY